MLCAYCCKQQPTYSYLMYANGSNVMCDSCWLNAHYTTWWLSMLVFSWRMVRSLLR